MPAAKRGRPTKRTEDRRDAILAGLSVGRTLASLCGELDIDFVTVYRWEQEDEAFRQATARAREVGTHHIADDTIRIADDPTIEAQQKRIMVDTRLRLIGKWNAKAYGDKTTTELTGADGKDLSMSDHESAAKLAAILEAVKSRAG